MIHLVPFVLLFLFALAQSDHPHLTGPNVCIEQTIEYKVVNITYMESSRVKEYTWCLKIPPRCPKFRTVMETRYKPENISRIYNHHHCCSGYQKVSGRCEPVCHEPCLHGKCVAPDVCSCEPGFSGMYCEEVGCKNGNWGPDCVNPCPCENEGRCDSNSGHCLCVPGYTGVHCQAKCDEKHYGHECTKKCKCGIGEKCHHVTGDCAPCPAGTYGKHCAQECMCSQNGTALCYHETGKCFCNANYYGIQCELFCPFGYLEGVCHSEPMPLGGGCSCPSILYRCDPDLGCVCKDGVDCDASISNLAISSLSSSSTDSSSHTQAVSIVLSVLTVALLITVVVVIYYRRRMKNLRRDLNNRSVYYVENSILDPARHGMNHDLIVTNKDPLTSSADEERGTGAVPRTSVTVNPSLPNNARVSSVKLEKNVNIDAFKLGTANYGACENSRDDEEAETEEVEPIVQVEPVDINVFDYTSPTHEKNNAILADLNRKTNKSSIDVILNNFGGSDEGASKENDEEEEDDVSAEKNMVVNLNRNKLDQ